MSCRYIAVGVLQRSPAGIARHRLATIADNRWTAEAGGDGRATRASTKSQREHAAGERLGRGPELFMDSAAIGARDKAARAVRSRADAIVPVPSCHRFERLPFGAFGVAVCFSGPPRNPTLVVGVALGLRDQHIRAPARAAT